MDSASLLQSSASRPGAHRPRPSRRRPPSSSRPTGAEDDSESARRAAGPEPRSPVAPHGGRQGQRRGRLPASASPGVCGPSHPARPGLEAAPASGLRSAGFPGGEERRAGVSRRAAGRSLPLHHSGLDLDLPHARIGHGPLAAAGRRGGAARRAGAEGAPKWAWCRECAHARLASPTPPRLPTPTWNHCL